MDQRELSYLLNAAEDRVEFWLGAAEFYEGRESEKKFSIDYRARGAAVYIRLRAALREQLCDPTTGRLRPVVALAADGDARDLTLVLVTIASVSAGIAISIALPLAALMARRGLRGICGDSPVSSGRGCMSLKRTPAAKKK